MNISSVIVYIKNQFEETLRAMEAIQGCEVHLVSKEQSIAIITLEAQGVEQEMKILEQVNALEGVLEAHLHYSYAQEELEEARTKLSNEISPILSDEVPLEEVHYSGSVYNQMHKE